MSDPNLIKAGGDAKRTNAEINAELKARAARAAAKSLSTAPDVEVVTCRVLKAGNDRISTGQHVAGIGEVHYEWKETFSCPRPRAEELEERGFVEIEGEPKE